MLHGPRIDACGETVVVPPSPFWTNVTFQLRREWRGSLFCLGCIAAAGAASVDGIERRRGSRRELHEWSWLRELRDEGASLMLVIDDDVERTPRRFLRFDHGRTEPLLRLAARYGDDDVARAAQRILEARAP